MRTPWTAADKLLITSVWPAHTAAECAAILGRSKESVESKAGDMGLRKDPAVVGKLRQRRNTGQPKGATLEQDAPDGPTVRPAEALRGVCYGKPVASAGMAVNGGRIARYVAGVA